MSSYASTASNTPQSVSSVPSSLASDTPTAAAAAAAAAGQPPDIVDDPLSLAEREARLQALLKESESVHAELSERMLDVYEKQGEKLQKLRVMEKTLSSQAGSLLKRLQSEEQSTSSLSSIIKRYKSDHKKLLSKISNPKWEISHHYHMTCIEHQLGHRQPHVLDVAELLPGHLRIYSLARVSSLYKRALMYYSTKSKSDRNSVSESIQESYKRLREVRKEMKEIMKMMDLMKAHMKAAGYETRSKSSSGSSSSSSKKPHHMLPRADSGSGEMIFDADHAAGAGGAAPSPPSSTQTSRHGPGPTAMSALMRSRQRMLGQGSPGSSRSSGPGVSGATRPGTMGSGTPISGSSSAGTSQPSNDPLAPMNPDAIVLPTSGKAFNALDTTTTPIGPSSLSTTSSTSTSVASSTSSSSQSSQSAYRMKYFKTLNLAPRLDFLHTTLPTTSSADQKKDMAESYNMDMKTIHTLLSSLETAGKESKEKAAELNMLQQYRKRMGVESLPLPQFDASTAIGTTGGGALDSIAQPHSPAMEDSDTEDSMSKTNSPHANAVKTSSTPEPFSLLAEPSSPSSPSASSSTNTPAPVSPSSPAHRSMNQRSASKQHSSDASSTTTTPSSPQQSSRSASTSVDSNASGMSQASAASSSSSSSSAARREREKSASRRASSPSSSSSSHSSYQQQPSQPVTLFSSRGSGSTKPIGLGGGNESNPMPINNQHGKRAMSSRSRAANVRAMAGSPSAEDQQR